MFGVGRGLKWGLLIGGAGNRAADGCADVLWPPPNPGGFGLSYPRLRREGRRC